jgi:hypothetical protein
MILASTPLQRAGSAGARASAPILLRARTIADARPAEGRQANPFAGRVQPHRPRLVRFTIYGALRAQPLRRRG